MHNDVLANKNCLITGSTGGIGKHLAFIFAESGVNLFLTSTNTKSLQTLKSSIKKKFPKSDVSTYPADLKKSSDFTKLVNTVRNKFGTIDILINSAGFYRDNSLIKTSLDEFDNTFSINVRAPFVLSHEFAKDMIKKKWGRIVNIGSSSAYAGKPEHPAYAASKHALLGLSKSLTKDLRRFNVRVFFVSPGPVKTKMAARWAKSAKNQKYETFIDPKEFSTFVRDLIKADSNMFIEEVRICRMNEG